ncbi:MAG TPA: ergothioneine biosynthesis glutamate--cysteine ligase EgtA [Micromonosporaceae bacterium]|nr:ergothioneine biosynthesis glutamate--cysteine ligase EgtA [Micromonosporaceae bacterium]
MVVEAEREVWSVIADREVAEGYVAKVCFKTGPPTRVGVELEWTVHHQADPRRPLDINALATVLGPYAPPTLVPGSPHQTLAGGGLVTVEPGGQVEISSPPYASLARLMEVIARDSAELERLLEPAGLRLGTHGCDPHRPPQRLVGTPRYRAMERSFDRIGPSGRTMMSGTAGLQISLDVGAADRAVARWDALHTLGPPLIALFANSPRHAGRDTGWASHRMRTWFDTDPVRTLPPEASADPIGAWARRVLDAPLLCLRQPGDCWDAPPGVTFADWIDGALPSPPTFDDLRYHLSTVFPPVRPRGHYEVRYLDAQPGAGWMVPVAMLAALFAREETVDAAAEIAAPAADRWLQAAQEGLSDAVIASVIPPLIQLACQALSDTDLPPPITTEVAERLSKHTKGASS